MRVGGGGNSKPRWRCVFVPCERASCRAHRRSCLGPSLAKGGGLRTQARRARTRGRACRPSAGPPGQPADPAAGYACASRVEASAIRRRAGLLTPAHGTSHGGARALDAAVVEARRMRAGEGPSRLGAEAPSRSSWPESLGASRCSATRTRRDSANLNVVVGEEGRKQLGRHSGRQAGRQAVRSSH